MLGFIVWLLLGKEERKAVWLQGYNQAINDSEGLILQIIEGLPFGRDLEPICEVIIDKIKELKK